MSANLHKVRVTADSCVFLIQAPAVAAALSRRAVAMSAKDEPLHALGLGDVSDAMADRMANAFAAYPVRNIEFARGGNGKWYVKVLLKAKAAAKPAPAPAEKAYVDTLDTSAKGNHSCPQCMGTGRYVTGMENGKPKFGTGICYRCKGKGYTTPIDRRRNSAYLEHAAARAMAADLSGEQSPLSQYFDDCEAFDWYYEFSDDHRVWKEGKTGHEELIDRSKTLGEDARAIYKAWHNHMFTGEAWSTDQAPKPVKSDYINEEA